MKKEQKMRKVYYSHIEYGEVEIPDELCGKDKIEVDNVKVHGVYYIHKEISIGNKKILVMV